MNKYHSFNRAIGFFLLVFLFPALAQAETKENRLKYEDKDIYVRVLLRSPDQMHAFYEGREFPKAAIDKVTATCNIAVIIKNKTKDILWLVLDDWEFNANGKAFSRLDRSYWAKKWDEVKLSQAHRSTFGWTLLPEVRDLRPEEGVGGGIPIPQQSNKLDLILKLPTGKNKQGPVKIVTMKNIQCAEDIDKK